MAKKDRMERLFKKHEKKLWKLYFKNKTEQEEGDLFEFYRMWAEEVYSIFLNKYKAYDGYRYYKAEFLPVAYIAIVKAIRKFKLDGGASFKTYASKYIRNELSNALYPFFHGNRTLKQIKFVGDILSEADHPLYNHRYHMENYDRDIIIREVSQKLKSAIAGWGYSKKEWKIFYYRIFKFMPVKEIEKKLKLSEWKVMESLAHMRKDILDEFGEKYKELIKGKYD